VIDPMTGNVEFDGPILSGQNFTHNGKVRLVIGRL
jgi:hypothetical protein